MNNAKSASNEFLGGAQSKCNPNIMSLSQSNSAGLQYYSKTDDTISTKVPISDRTRATVHKDHGDSETKPKIPVDNIKEEQDAKRIRPERFVSDSILPNRPFGDQYGFIPFFIKKAAENLKLTKHRLPSKDSGVVPMVVEKAAVGITREAAQQDLQSEGQYTVDELLKVKDLGMKEVWKCCAHLYTESTFLYKLINETMRWIGDEEHKSIWEDRVETLGPFCLLLWDNPFDKHMTKPETILYRGARLSKDYIAAFNNSWTKDSRALHSFQAFTSCTRNRQVAEIFAGNGVLFVMRVKLAFTVDLKPYSQFPDEEEELLFPGACFRIDRLQVDKDAKLYLIHLTLHQKHDRSDQHRLSSTIPITSTHMPIPTDVSKRLQQSRNNNDKHRDGFIDFFDYHTSDYSTRSTHGIDHIRPFLALRYEPHIHRDGENNDWSQQ